MSDFFDGFTLTTIDTPHGAIRLRHGGSGPPLLLLHGNPQTHAMWHKVAPALATSFSVVCPDLRGYGGSHKPGPTADHAPYAKTAMAAEMVATMDALGHTGPFALVGHDRGARVAHRLALDAPDRVTRLAVLDIIPTIEHFERTDMAFAMGYYHWFWLAQPHPFPECLIDAAPETWWFAHAAREPKDRSFFHPDALADYLAAARRPETTIGMCEDYRAGATVDMEHDRASRDAGQRIRCPLRVLWGKRGKIDVWYEDPVRIWCDYANGPVDGHAIPAGHFLAEEAPDAVIATLQAFLTETPVP
jgi:haloacetate dehalogenase